MSGINYVRTGEAPDRKVEKLVAYIAVDPKTGLEGIMAAGAGQFDLTPLVFTEGNPAFEKLKPMVLECALKHGMQIKIKRFKQTSEEWLT